MGFLRSQNRVERLFELPRGGGIDLAGGFVAVRDGEVYFTQFHRRSAFTLAAIPLRRGPSDLRILLEGTGKRVPDLVQLAGGRIVYLVTDTLPGSVAPSSGAPTSRTALLPSPDGPEFSRFPAGGARARPDRRRAWWLPRTGGEPQELIPNEVTSTILVSGEYCYWVRQPHGGRRRRLTRAEFTAPTGELLAVPLSGGPPRRIARVPEYVALSTCGSGICWRAGTPPQSALFTTGPPDFEIEAVPGYPAVASPIWIGDRLYWLDGGAPQPPTEAPRGASLVSTRRDGTDRQILYGANYNPDAPQQLSLLLDDGQSLYFCADRMVGGKLQRSFMRRSLTANEQPELLLQTSLPSLRPLAAEAGYLYLISWEERENWFDWSARGLLRRRVGVLSRIPLAR